VGRDPEDLDFKIHLREKFASVKISALYLDVINIQDDVFSAGLSRR
jgi:hypothetical protein